MPNLRDPNDRPGIWKVLKAAIGKDITKFSVPVYINEPISMVQKVTEIMEYEELLVKANNEPDSKKRIMFCQNDNEDQDPFIINLDPNQRNVKDWIWIGSGFQ